MAISQEQLGRMANLRKARAAKILGGISGTLGAIGAGMQGKDPSRYVEAGSLRAVEDRARNMEIQRMEMERAAAMALEDARRFDEKAEQARRFKALDAAIDKARMELNNEAKNADRATQARRDSMNAGLRGLQMQLRENEAQRQELDAPSKAAVEAFDLDERTGRKRTSMANIRATDPTVLDDSVKALAQDPNKQVDLADPEVQRILQGPGTTDVKLRAIKAVNPELGQDLDSTVDTTVRERARAAEAEATGQDISTMTPEAVLEAKKLELEAALTNEQLSESDKAIGAREILNDPRLSPEDREVLSNHPVSLGTSPGGLPVTTSAATVVDNVRDTRNMLIDERDEKVREIDSFKWSGARNVSTQQAFAELGAAQEAITAPMPSMAPEGAMDSRDMLRKTYEQATTLLPNEGMVKAGRRQIEESDEYKQWLQDSGYTGEAAHANKAFKSYMREGSRQKREQAKTFRELEQENLRKSLSAYGQRDEDVLPKTPERKQQADASQVVTGVDNRISGEK